MNGSALNGSGASAKAPAAPETPAASTEAPASPEDSRGSRPAHRRLARPRRRLAGALAGLAAGLIIGIGGAAGVAQLAKAPPAHVVARIELSPLPQFPQWQGTTGTAVMRATASQREIVVTLRLLAHRHLAAAVQREHPALQGQRGPRLPAGRRARRRRDHPGLTASGEARPAVCQQESRARARPRS
jgi:hypothetical protein